MFLGHYQSFLEDDRSLVIPKPFCEPLAGGAYVTRGFEQNLLIMDEKVFQELYQRAAGLNITDPRARLLQRLILGNASRIEIGATGQVLIPQELMAFANLEKELFLVGQGDYLEVWAPAHWEQQTLDLQDIEANSERFAELELCLH